MNVMLLFLLSSVQTLHVGILMDEADPNVRTWS